jgi:hypothetical protein
LDAYTYTTPPCPRYRQNSGDSPESGFPSPGRDGERERGNPTEELAALGRRRQKTSAMRVVLESDTEWRQHTVSLSTDIEDSRHA